jgi:hypothetical protein
MAASSLAFMRSLVTTNLKAALALRSAFVIQVVFMALNNFTFFVSWWAARFAAAAAVLLGPSAALVAEVGVSDGPNGVVINSRTGQAYVAFSDLGILKIVSRRSRRSSSAYGRSRLASIRRPT